MSGLREAGALLLIAAGGAAVLLVPFASPVLIVFGRTFAARLVGALLPVLLLAAAALWAWRHA